MKKVLNILIITAIPCCILLGYNSNSTTHRKYEQQVYNKANTIAITHNDTNQQAAQQVADTLYFYIKNKDSINAEKLFGQKFYKFTSKTQLREGIATGVKRGGEIVNSQLIKQSIINKDTSIFYMFFYKVERVNKTFTEKITVLKENDSLKIYGYLINFDAK